MSKIITSAFGTVPPQRFLLGRPIRGVDWGGLIADNQGLYSRSGMRVCGQTLDPLAPWTPGDTGLTAVNDDPTAPYLSDVQPVLRLWRDYGAAGAREIAVTLTILAQYCEFEVELFAADTGVTIPDIGPLLAYAGARGYYSTTVNVPMARGRIGNVDGGAPRLIYASAKAGLDGVGPCEVYSWQITEAQIAPADL